MGRRAKNKQGAPEPLVQTQTVSPKKLGKRKADSAAEKASPRPSKKLKNSSKENKMSGKSHKKSSKKKAVEEGDEDEDLSADGWEDVEDGDLKVQVRCANIRVDYHIRLLHLRV